MCEICRQNPCSSRCPNAPDPQPIKFCSECGEGIFEGDKYFDGEVETICMNCMEEKDLDEILEIFGEKMTVAEVA